MTFSVALKMLWRDWRAGELTLLLVSLIVAVGTVTTITLFVDRLQQALENESATFLAADRVITSSDPIDPEVLRHAAELGLRQAQTLSFLSMVFSGDRAQFASVKAVDDHYPLRGTLIVSDRPFVRGTLITHGPPPGELWLESRLMPSLGIDKGDILDIGVATFPVGKVLVKEPDRGGGFNSAGPRVMMNLADVAATGVVQPGSRITWRYLFAGDERAVAEFEAWVKPRLGLDARILGIREGAAGIGSALERAERFLLLGGLLGVILAGVAIALAAQRYARRHFDHIAIMKTLGASPATIDSIFILMFLVLGVVATLLGSLVGLLVQTGAVKILEPLIPVALPAPGFRPVGVGMMTGFVCLLAFALPPLLGLRQIVPVRVIRRDLETPGISGWLAWAFAFAGMAGLMLWYSQDLRLTMMIFSGGIVAASLLSAVAWVLLHSGRLLGMQAGSAWRLALAGMRRRGKENTLQILVFGLAIMLLLVLYLVRTALIEEWRAQIPPDAPNHFAINISPEDVVPIRELFASNGVESQPLYPMIRGRIASINSESSRLREQARNGNEGAPRASSDRNLTWSARLPDDNRIVAGKWWAADYDGPPLVSLEREIASANQLKVGDELVFRIQGRELMARVASIRTVAWDNMQPNFYIIFSPGSLADFPSTWMTSFFLPKDRKLFLNTLLSQYPTMTVIEVDALIEQIQIIISQVTLAIELVLVLILVSGGLVLLASVQSSMDERFVQHAILRTLGASGRLVLGSLVIEFSALGFFAGILATLGSEITVYVLETGIFELDYSVNPVIWLMGPLAGTVLIGVTGTLATRKVVRTPPTVILRGLE